MVDKLTEFPGIYGLFFYNLSFNIGYPAVLNSGSTQILSILNEAGPFGSVRNATDIPDQSMWVFTFVKNPYDRALLTWNQENVDLILSPAAKAQQFYDDMLVIALDTRRGDLADHGNYRTQFDLLDEVLGNERNGGRKANFIGRMETFETDMLTVQTQMDKTQPGISLNIVPEDTIGYPDGIGESVLVDKDTVFADTTYDSYLSYADAYSSQQTKDLIYFIYREDFDTYLYAQ